MSVARWLLITIRAMSDYAAPRDAGSAEATRRPGVLLLHGLTGSPRSLGGLAAALRDQSYEVEAPILPGHASSVDDLEKTRFADWLGAARERLWAMCERFGPVAVIGHSMGGTLACFLALEVTDVAALVLINPMLKPPALSLDETLRTARSSGVSRLPSIGSDIAMAGVETETYDEVPIDAVLSLFDATRDLAGRLASIRCPVLLFSSRVDHVVPSDSGDLIERALGEKLQRIWLEKSYHVATLDYDATIIEQASIGFLHEELAA